MALDLVESLIVVRDTAQLSRAQRDVLADAANEITRMKNIRSRLDGNLNDYLCGMKPEYDDSITGFNEAWDVMRKTFDAK